MRYRVVEVLDHLDTQVERLRKDAVRLTERRDMLHMSMDVLKNNEILASLNECKWNFTPEKRTFCFLDDFLSFFPPLSDIKSFFLCISWSNSFIFLLFPYST